MKTDEWLSAATVRLPDGWFYEYFQMHYFQIVPLFISAHFVIPSGIVYWRNITINAMLKLARHFWRWKHPLKTCMKNIYWTLIIQEITVSETTLGERKSGRNAGGTNGKVGEGTRNPRHYTMQAAISGQDCLWLIIIEPEWSVTSKDKLNWRPSSIIYIIVWCFWPFMGSIFNRHPVNIALTFLWAPHHY